MNTSPHTGKVLVVGLGIAGMATANALHRAGWQPTIIERSTERRRGGYFIALAGTGRIAAEHLGILDYLEDRTSGSGKHQVLYRDGRTKPGLGFGDQPGRPWMMVRGDVENAAHQALDPSIEIRFATVPVSIEQDADGVNVVLRDETSGTETTERFELVVGADGVHSSVRRMVFGREEEFAHPMGYAIAAYELSEALPGLPPGQGATISEPGRSFWVFPFKDRLSTALFSFRIDDPKAVRHGDPVEMIRRAYGPEPLGAAMEAALGQLKTADAKLFDSVEQIRMDTWHRGRVVVLGDAAWCVSLYSGLGVTSALAGADLLGAEFAHSSKDVPGVLADWDRKLRPYIEYYRGLGVKQRFFFTAANRGEAIARAGFITLLSSKKIQQLFLGQGRESKASRMRESDIVAATRNA